MDIRTNTNGLERRFYDLRSTVDMDSRSLSGYAAVYNSLSEDFGGFREIIAPGAFTDALKDADIRLLYNHESRLVLGRTKSGTLEIEEDERGVRFSGSIGEQSYANDVLLTVQRGDVDQASFGFVVDKGDVEWEKRDGQTVRIIKRIKRLLELSVVTFPAYPETAVAVREYQAYVDQAEEARAYQAQLFKYKTIINNGSINHIG